MGKIFGEHPKNYSGGNKGQGAHKMMGANSKGQQDYGVRRIERRRPIDLMAGDHFLLTLINAIRMFLPNLTESTLSSGHKTINLDRGDDWLLVADFV